ncbi:hypothetical protein CBS101457_002439 [Exobasidium rhododendri]|nr:hypothetical protein CBS101457_002439 [Exobasidium rhododendri]
MNQDQDRNQQQQQQQYLAPPLPPTSSSSSSSSRAPVVSLPDEQCQAAIAQYGSPYATNEDWRPSQTFEPRLSKIPALGIGMRIKQRFARKAGDIWNPPAPSFVRGIPVRLSNTPFAPIHCKGAGELASNGFDPIFPGALMGAHDVSAADWHRFLQDLEVAGRLTGGQGAIANIAPLTMHMGVTGYFVTKAITKGMARKKEPVVYETLEEWEQRFFLPRGLDVYICNAEARLTATSVGGRIDSLPAALSPIQNNYTVNSDHSHEPTAIPAREKKKDRERREKKEKEEDEKNEKRDKDKKKKDKKDKKSSLVLVIAPASQLMGQRYPQSM